MSDSGKDKIAFVIGLLAVLFTLTPLVEAHGTLGFTLFGIGVHVSHLYNVMAVSLGLSVYAYGVQFVTERRFKATAAVGDIFYALAIVAPGVFVGMFLAAEITEIVARVLQSPALSSVIQSGLSIVTAIGGAIAGFRFQRVLDLKQKKVEATRQNLAELNALQRAEQLYESSYYDLAVVEAFKALELAARALQSDDRKGATQRDWLEPIMARVPDDLKKSVDEVRRVRNMAAHANTPVSQATAREALTAANKVLAVLSDVHSDTCPRCGKHGMRLEEGSDHGFHWERRRCPHCGFVDLD
jgi:predicted RNA-binding Zn-ribbon protein involved in translation (DUF1610 family)